MRDGHEEEVRMVLKSESPMKNQRLSKKISIASRNYGPGGSSPIS